MLSCPFCSGLLLQHIGAQGQEVYFICENCRQAVPEQLVPSQNVMHPQEAIVAGAQEALSQRVPEPAIAGSRLP
jgi:hypothetical protein